MELSLAVDCLRRFAVLHAMSDFALVAVVCWMCAIATMRLWTTATMAFAASTAIVTLSGCNRPVSDTEKLKAIRAEAQALMNTHAPKQPGKCENVRKEQWPKATASLLPEDVAVCTWGVAIRIKADFDGGWGYHVPRGKPDLPMPVACYSEISEGVFWHRPC